MRGSIIVEPTAVQNSYVSLVERVLDPEIFCESGRADSVSVQPDRFTICAAPVR
jgi:hypothetical protein